MRRTHGMTHGILMASIVAAAACGSPGVAQEAYTSDACRVSFRHPSEWVVRQSPIDADPCALVVEPPSLDSLLVASDSVDVYTVSLWVLPVGFDDAVGGSPFERRDDGWVVGGRLGLENPARAVSNGMLRGVRGSAPFGCYRINGGYVGACESPAALVGTDERSVEIEGGRDEAFELVLSTLEVLP